MKILGQPYCSITESCIFTHYKPSRTNNAINLGTSVNGEPSISGAPLVMDPINSSTLYQGRLNIWKTTNATTPGTPTWAKISDFYNDPNILAGFYQAATALSVAPSNPNFIYVTVSEDGPHNPDVFMTSVGGGVGNWQKITPINVNLRMTGLAISNENPQHVWITYSGYNASYKVKESINGGNSWTDVPWINSTTSNALPNLPINCIVYEKGSNDGIYVGTDVGVYYHNNSMNGWEPFMDGLPNVVVNWLEINYSAPLLGGNKIRAATFGRGLWESDLACPVTPDINYTSTSNPNSGVLSGFYEAQNTVTFNPAGSDIFNSGSVTVRAGISIDLKATNNNKIHFTPTSTSKVHLFIHGCDASHRNSFRLASPNNSSQQNNNAEVNWPITQSDNFKFTYYPNPFTDHLHIDFMLEKNSPILVSVYNYQGQLIETLANGSYEAGEHTLVFDKTSLKPGVYFVRIDMGDKHYAKAVIKSAE